MKINIYSLYTKPMARFLARISRKCTVILTTGKTVQFQKGRKCAMSSYEGTLSKREEFQWIHAMMLIGT